MPWGSATVEVSVGWSCYLAKYPHYWIIVARQKLGVSLGSNSDEPPLRMPRLIHVLHRNKERAWCIDCRSQDHDHGERPLLEGRSCRQDFHGERARRHQARNIDIITRKGSRYCKVSIIWDWGLSVILAPNLKSQNLSYELKNMFMVC